jgi:heat shock protein beta
MKYSIVVGGWLGGVQILFLTDPIDEYLTQNLTEYEGNKFQNASKDDLKIGSKYDQARIKEIKESYKEVTKWWKDILSGENVESVKVQICSFTTWVDFAWLLILKR